MNNKIRNYLFKYKKDKDRIKIIHKILGSIGLLFFLWMPILFDLINIELTSNNIQIGFIIMSCFFGLFLSILNIKSYYKTKVKVVSLFNPDVILSDSFIKDNKEYRISLDWIDKKKVRFSAVSDKDKFILYDTRPLSRIIHND